MFHVKQLHLHIKNIIYTSKYPQRQLLMSIYTKNQSQLNTNYQIRNN